MTPEVSTVRTDGLGDSTYILIHDGLAVVVDPQRDIDRFESTLDADGAELRMVLETHLHNDYVSGGRDLARARGADLVMPAGAAPVFRHIPAFHMEDLTVGSMTIRPIHTPGHTPEHTSYLVIIDGDEVALFSGGSLLVGAAGRTDLLGEQRAESLARLQYHSVHRLADLPSDVGLYPTHGEGSFCTTSGAGAFTSSIGVEVRTNPVLAYPDEDAFVTGQLSGLVRYPSYYRHMGPINLKGLAPPSLTVPVAETVPEGTTVIDARPRDEFAAGHLPGTLSLELGESFGTWVGWLTEHNSPLTLVLDKAQNTDEAMRQLARIGYDDVRGVVRPDPASFTASFDTADEGEFAAAAADGAQILDVRAPDEWESGTIPGSTLTYLPDLVQQTPALDPDRPVWVVCASGFRAIAAASILQARGFDPIALSHGGATEVLLAASNAR